MFEGKLRYARILAAGLALMLVPLVSNGQDAATDLTEFEWSGNAVHCDALEKDEAYPEWHHIAYSPTTHIFRQNKCSHYEAPFVYLFVGANKALLIDTGATEESGVLLLQLVRSITSAPLIVVHTHRHGDHKGGDGAFKTAENTEFIRIGITGVLNFLGLDAWPDDPVGLDLGDRMIELISTPGHTDDHVIFYDTMSQILLTGDMIYPGNLYVDKWPAYVDSIGRILAWMENKPVSHVLGAHVEVPTTPGQPSAVGKDAKPYKAPLALELADIEVLYDAVSVQETPQPIAVGKFVVLPRAR